MNIRSFAVLATLCLGLAARSAWPAGQTLEMQVGESRVLAESGVTRVAIGDSQVLSAIATDSREVVVFARTEGVSSIQVWADGGVQAYDVHVAAAGVTRLRAEVDALLARIPGPVAPWSVAVSSSRGMTFPMTTTPVSRRWRNTTPRSWTSPAGWGGTAWCSWMCRWWKCRAPDCARSACAGKA